MLKNPDQSSTKPLLGVSACLLGHAVRYDGNDKRNSYITEVLSRHCEFLAICPEAEAGLGIPRPPVQLVGNLHMSRALGRDDPQLDVTEKLESFAQQQLSQLNRISGFIFKSRSPSCGLTDTPVYNPHNFNEFQTGSGLFARKVTEALPSLPVCDENMLTDEDFAEQFLQRIFKTHALMTPDR